MNNYDEDEDLLNVTYYDRKAVEHWAGEEINETEINAPVKDLAELVGQPHPFCSIIT